MTLQMLMQQKYPGFQKQRMPSLCVNVEFLPCSTWQERSAIDIAVALPSRGD